MARRRRLDPPSPEALEAARAPAPPRAPALGPVAPIAAAAGAAARAGAEEIARLRSAAERLSAAEADGRILLDIPLAEIEQHYIARDRLLREAPDEEARVLKASIREHGQRVPVEVLSLGPEAPRPWGLISGYRRMRALAELHRETGDPRFARVRALLQQPAGLGNAFLAMVEENEVRAGLSFYERGRICALAAEQGAFDSAEAALEALFASVPKARRSKIRSFLRIHRELGHVLAWPEHLSERLGLKLAAALKWGQGGRIAGALSVLDLAAADPEAEALVLADLLADGSGRAEAPAAPARTRAPDPGRAEIRSLPGGLRIERRSFAGHTDLRLSGPGLDETQIARALEAVAAALSAGQGAE